MLCNGNRALCLVVLSCWMTGAIADSTSGGVAKPGAPVLKKLPNSRDLLDNEKATPEDDFEAGKRAYLRGELVEAQGIFERAARRGHSGAMAELAKLLDRSGFYAEAAEWFRKSAELGDPEGQFGLGTMMLDYNSYDLTKMKGQVDVVEARKWFELAAEQGHHEAITAVYAAYTTSGLGVSDEDRTDEAVLKWTRIAAESGNGDAMLALSRFYRDGKHGLAADPKLAAEWEAKSRDAHGIREEVKSKAKKTRVY